MLLSVPAHENQYGAADELVGHYRRYGRETLTRRLHDAGFEVVGSAATAPVSATCSRPGATHSRSAG